MYFLLVILKLTFIKIHCKVTENVTSFKVNSLPNNAIKFSKSRKSSAGNF